MLAYTVHHCIHACAKNNNVFTTTCLSIPMHPHNLSLVEKCVIKLSKFPITVAQLAQFLIILYASTIAAYADFKSLFARTIWSA